MKKCLLLFLLLIIFSCLKNDIVQSQTANTDPWTMHNGQQFPTVSRSYTDFCRAPKTCKFLFKNKERKFSKLFLVFTKQVGFLL